MRYACTETALDFTAAKWLPKGKVPVYDQALRHEDVIFGYFTPRKGTSTNHREAQQPGWWQREKLWACQE
jgi:hypothetical protein